MFSHLLPLLVLASTVLASPAVVSIHFQQSNKCLDVRGGVFANGTPVEIYDCQGSNNQRWVMNDGSTKVQVHGTNYCLDSSPNPKNGVQLIISECKNTPQQQWFYTRDNRLAIKGQIFCVDLDNGDTSNGHKVQNWLCEDNDTNQIWTLKIEAPLS